LFRNKRSCCINWSSVQTDERTVAWVCLSNRLTGERPLLHVSAQNKCSYCIAGSGGLRLASLILFYSLPGSMQSPGGSSSPTAGEASRAPRAAPAPGPWWQQSWCHHGSPRAAFSCRLCARRNPNPRPSGEQSLGVPVRGAGSRGGHRPALLLLSDLVSLFGLAWSSLLCSHLLVQACGACGSGAGAL